MLYVRASTLISGPFWLGYDFFKSGEARKGHIFVASASLPFVLDSKSRFHM
jgi:hypothetical protein